MFEDINYAQWIFYSKMLFNEKKSETDTMVAIADYLASFWNPDAVKKIQEARNLKSEHAFKNDTEFEQSLVSGEYKNNPLLDAIINLKKKEKSNFINNNEDANPNHPRIKMPTDLSSIKTTLNKFNKG